MSDANILSLLQTISARLGNIEAHVGLSSGGASAGGSSDDVPRSIKAFDAYVAAAVDPFVAACSKLGGDAEKLGKLTKETWLEMRSFLLLASACKEPSQAELAPLLGGVSSKLKEIGMLVNRNEWEKHSKTVSEGAQCVNWLCVKPAPRDFIETFIGGSEYWSNGIRREYRTSNPDQIAFCDTFKVIITDLMAYVKEYHTTGVSWNPKGVSVSEYSPSASAAPKATESKAAENKPAAKPSANASVNMFADLNKGGAITSGLKTVTKDQQTWRSEFKGGDAPVVKKAPVPQARPKETAKGPAKLEFQPGPSKWLVENQVADGGVVTVTIGDMKETVYVFGCVGATINVVGKCKSIIVDGCKKTRVQFDDVMASFEVVNSVRINVECRSKVASVAIDKTDGIVVHLPRSSLDTTVVSSKSSEMNISWPQEDGEIVEKPIPEQYIHRIDGMKITADVSDLYS